MKKILIFGILISVLVIINSQNKFEKGIVLDVKEKIELSKLKNNGYGFTCTGITSDTNYFYIGNIGKKLPEDKEFKSTIEIVDKNIKNIVRTIELYKIFPKMKDIQGLTIEKDRIYFCSYAENKIRSIDINGNEINYFYVKNPIGIEYDRKNNTLWVLTKENLINYNLTGEEIKKFKVKVKGQDQLYLNEEKNIMYFSAGADYKKENYIYELNLENGKYKLKYILEDSFAIEGIIILSNKLYVLNDGYYHQAKIKENLINIYNLDE